MVDTLIFPILNHQDIQEAVSSILPDLSDKSLTSLLESFEELGVDSREDLTLAQEQEKELERYLQ